MAYLVLRIALHVCLRVPARACVSVSALGRQLCNDCVREGGDARRILKLAKDETQALLDHAQQDQYDDVRIHCAYDSMRCVWWCLPLAWLSQPALRSLPPLLCVRVPPAFLAGAQAREEAAAQGVPQVPRTRSLCQ